MVKSMMSFLSLPVSFWGYALDTAPYFLNLVTSKTVPLTPIKMWKGRKPSLQHIHIWGCSTHVLKPKVTLEDTPALAQGTLGLKALTPIIPVSSRTPMPRHSWRVIIQLDRAMEAKLESKYSNKVWDLVEAPEEIKPIGCKWVYKRKKGAIKTLDFDQNEDEPCVYKKTWGSMVVF
ncbi:hypothetical protein CK203_101179 [Vitis vinifera]|uniref:Retrovirus-related Pol polyprotein from transposon TNT 1-94 n=1 Tax=Vitis vinifera TaxID=29760 RepID=A0A438EDF0_VITVI|nr:hypothetical protein CK203_101179 [Vitis vinifera]